MWYFAFGSNMDREAMRSRCPHARPAGTAILHDFRFVISRDGYASIAPRRGACVHGVLWRLTPRDLAALNAYENLASGLYRTARLSVLQNGRRTSALVYIGRRGLGRPRPAHLATIVAAARDWKFPKPYVDKLARWGMTGGARPQALGAAR
jgi:cation transport regulator ChaC